MEAEMKARAERMWAYMPDVSVVEVLQMDYDDQLGSFVTEAMGTVAS
jgi:hypothetical protein